MEGPLVSFILPMYNDYPMTIPALFCQTHENFEIILVHDGPVTGSDAQHLRAFSYDPRLKIYSTVKPGNDWGHRAREYGIQFLSPESKYVVFGGVDNYYMPEFIEYLIKPMETDPEREFLPGVVATYCDCLHNIRRWDKMSCEIRMGLIDCGNFMTRTEYARAVGWKYRDYEADWKYIQDLQRLFCKKPGAIKKIDRTLFIHN